MGVVKGYCYVLKYLVVIIIPTESNVDDLLISCNKSERLCLFSALDFLEFNNHNIEHIKRTYLKC